MENMREERLSRERERVVASKEGLMVAFVLRCLMPAAEEREEGDVRTLKNRVLLSMEGSEP